MPEEERAPTDRHATWVALRTFRQRPAVVGRTEQGETIYEVRAVRLLCPPGSSHFKRLVQCAKCQIDMAGSPMLSPDDLDRQPNPVFCRRCVRPAPAMVEAPTPVAPAPAAPQAEPAVTQDGGRLAAVEAGLGELARRLHAPPAADPQVAPLSAAVAELRGELHEVARAVEQAGSSAEASVRRLLEEELREVEQAVDGVVRRALAAVGEPLGELTGGQQALEEKLSDAERRLDALTASVDASMSRQHVMEQKLNECMEQVRRLAEARPEAPPEPSPRAPGEILEGLERQLRAAEERLAQR